MFPLNRRTHEEVADAYKECFEHYGENSTDREIFACVASSIAVDEPNRNYARSIFLVYAASMVFFMQVRVYCEYCENSLCCESLRFELRMQI
jgi:hypothetical protein